MKRNHLYFVIAVLVAAIFGLGYYFYQEEQRGTEIDIEIGDGGVSVETD